MVNYRHNICLECWNQKNPENQLVRIPLSLLDPDGETCCFCGRLNYDGIFVREHPDKTRCKGLHDQK